MPYYLTGTTRTRTLSASITFTDGGGSFSTEGAVVFGNVAVRWTTSWADYSSGGGGGGGGGLVIDEEDPLPPAGRRVTLRITTQTPTSSLTQTYTIDDPTSLTGTITLSAAVREIADVGFRAAGVGEPGMAWGVRCFEYLFGTASASATILGQSQSSSSSSSVARQLAQWSLLSKTTIPGGGGSGGQAVSITSAPTTGTVSATSSSKSKSATYSAGGISYTYAGSSSATSTSATTSASASSTPGGFAHGYAYAFVQVRPDIVGTLNGRLQRLPAAWPTGIEYRLTDGGAWASAGSGDFSAAISQKSFTTQSEVKDHTTAFGFASDTHSASERANLRPAYRFPGDSLPAGYLELYGPRWDAISLAWASSQSVDDGSSLTPSGAWGGAWQSVSGSTLSVVSGAIRATGASGKSFQRTFGSATWNAYTRLRIRLKSSSASHTITVRLGADSTLYGVTYRAKRWALQTGDADTFTDLYLDLGAETSGPTYSTWDTAGNVAIGNSIPAIDPGGGYAYNAAYYTTTGTLTFEDLDAGTYEIDEIVAMTAPDGAGGHTAPLIHTDPHGGAASYRLLVGQCDGQQVFLVGGGSTGSNRGTTIAQLVAAVTGSAYTGWSASNLSPATSPDPSEPWPLSELTTGRHPALFIGGNGLLWDGASQTWSLTFDAGAQAVGNLPAQWMVYDAAWDWPESTCIGWRTLDSGTWHLGAAWVVGGSVWGRVFDTTTAQTPGDESAPCGRDPLASATLNLLDATGATVATTTSDAGGVFRLPALAELSGTARVQLVGRPGWLDVPMWTTPGRARAVLMATVPPDGTLLAMAVSATGRVCRAYRDPSNNLVLEYWVRVAWEPHTTGLSVSGNGALCYDVQSESQRLHLVIEDSGAIKGRYTDDEGASWSTAVTVASAGSNPALCVSPTGMRHYFWIDSGAIKTLITDSLGNTTTAATTVVSSGVAASQVDVVHDGELLILTYKTSGGAVASLVSSDGGLTFV